MKRVLLVLLIPILLFLVVPASANEVYNFQNPTEFGSRINFTETSCSDASFTWTQSLNGGNSYYKIFASNGPGSDDAAAVVSQVPTLMTYAAATYLGRSHASANPSFTLYDATFGELYNYYGASPAANSRIEMKMIGGAAYIYDDGVELAHSGALAQNPSFVGIGVVAGAGPGCGASNVGAYWDDIVWGSSEPLVDTASDKYVYGMPELTPNGTPYYMIMRDFINPAANGFYYGNGTLISSVSFTTTFAKGNGNNDTVYFQGYTTGENVLPAYTGTVYAGTITWTLAPFFAANPNYGLYADHSNSSLKYSDLVFYTGNGATISWDRTSYSLGETGTITTAVTDGGYWNPTDYDYRVDVIDIYGIVDGTYPITTQNAATTHTWDTDQDIGVYYAVIIAEPKNGDDDIWMAIATTNLDAYLTMHGYVFDAETELVIPNATVNITQGILTSAPVTPVDGNYTVTGMAQGGTISIHVNATDYDDYEHSFTPLRVGQLLLNFTLMPSSPTYTGNAIGGLAFEPPYNRTIPSATIEIQNGTDYNATSTNTVGYYIKNSLEEGSEYTIWGSKSGFLNSSDYVLTTVAGWNRQDVIMEGMYTLQIAFKDSVTHNPIPVVTVIDSNGYNQTTSTGTYTYSYNYSVVVLYASSEGYTATSRSYVMDEDRSATVYLTASSSSFNASPASVQSYPKYVTFHVKQGWGEPLDEVKVELTPVSTSTGDWDWLATILGVDLGEIPLNTNAMNQTTDSLGTATFYIFPTAKYNVTFTKAGYTIPSMILVPRDDHYVIYATSADTTYYRYGQDELSAVNISIVQNHLNASYTYLNLTYLDTSAGTTGGTIAIWQKSSVPYGSASLIASWPVTGNSFTNSTGITHVQRVSGIVQANVTHSTFGTILRSYPFQLNSVPVEFLGFGDEIQLLVALGMMLFTAMLAGATHARQIIIVVGMEASFFHTFGWFSALASRMNPLEPWAANTTIWAAIVVMTVIGVAANFAERKRRGI